jgi:hypothetical protein
MFDEFKKLQEKQGYLLRGFSQFAEMRNRSSRGMCGIRDC